MSYRLIFTDSYNKKAAKWIKKHPALKDQYLKTLQLMELDIYHPSLRLHKLSGSLTGLSSISINISYRITLELMIQDRDIILINIGSHDEVYR
ncbi:MAG: plasmid stabilization protein [Alphaproteobacteria bacterium]|nr:plasmid stabilization protein [Alphaproteobacteria bacterium]